MKRNKMSKLDFQRFDRYYGEKRSTYDPLQRRLAHEHLLVESLCADHNDIESKLLHPDQLPPLDYRITFTGLKSIVGIDDDQLPKFGDVHVMEIRMTHNYPVEPPVCYMCTDIWHPNIQSDPGPFQGRICGNTEGFGSYYTLDELILRIRSMLSYETYHATMTDPFPEDENVARWVREFGEPLGIVQLGRGLDQDWKAPENWREMVSLEKKVRISMV